MKAMTAPDKLPDDRQEYLEHNFELIPVKKGSFADKMSQHPRLTGLGCLVFAAIFAKFEILDVIADPKNYGDAGRGQQHDVIATGLFLGIGIGLILGGRAVDDLLKAGGVNQAKTSWKSWLLALSCLLPALLIHLWLEYHLFSSTPTL